MRKEIVALPSENAASPEGAWLDLDARAGVLLTSEDPAWPIENALRALPGKGWKAAQPGSQTIWIHFDEPQDVSEIHVAFEVAERRTQEFVLLSSNDGGRSYREIVRQQFNFSSHARVEEEHYFANLTAVSDVKLNIVPDIAGGEAHATLRALRLR